jgi:hypothetical protein
MEVTINGTRQLAEHACRMVFGEDANAGPVRPAPKPLLDFLAAWPGHADDVLEVALHLPWDFDIGRGMAKDNVKAVTLRVCRMSILCQGKLVGHALRTNNAGIDAIALYDDAKRAYDRRIRQAH